MEPVSLVENVFPNHCLSVISDHFFFHINIIQEVTPSRKSMWCYWGSSWGLKKAYGKVYTEIRWSEVMRTWKSTTFWVRGNIQDSFSIAQPFSATTLWAQGWRWFLIGKSCWMYKVYFISTCQNLSRSNPIDWRLWEFLVRFKALTAQHYFYAVYANRKVFLAPWLQ